MWVPTKPPCTGSVPVECDDERIETRGTVSLSDEVTPLKISVVVAFGPADSDITVDTVGVTIIDWSGYPDKLGTAVVGTTDTLATRVPVSPSKVDAAGVPVVVSGTETRNETVDADPNVCVGLSGTCDTSVVGTTETPEGIVPVIPSWEYVAGEPVSDIETPTETVGTFPGVSGEMRDGKDTSVVATAETPEGRGAVTSF